MFSEKEFQASPSRTKWLLNDESWMVPSENLNVQKTYYLLCMQKRKESPKEISQNVTINSEVKFNFNLTSIRDLLTNS